MTCCPVGDNGHPMDLGTPATGSMPEGNNIGSSGLTAGQQATYQGPPCRHGHADRWDCTTCSREMFGGETWRTCRHGYRRGECPTCDRDRNDDKAVVDW